MAGSKRLEISLKEGATQSAIESTDCPKMIRETHYKTGRETTVLLILIVVLLVVIYRRQK